MSVYPTHLWQLSALRDQVKLFAETERDLKCAQSVLDEMRTQANTRELDLVCCYSLPQSSMDLLIHD